MFMQGTVLPESQQLARATLFFLFSRVQCSLLDSALDTSEEVYDSSGEALQVPRGLHRMNTRKRTRKLSPTCLIPPRSKVQSEPRSWISYQVAALGHDIAPSIPRPRGHTLLLLPGSEVYPVRGVDRLY